MNRLPIELLDGVFETLEWRDLVACRAVNRLWRGLIDGDDATAQAPSVASFQGKLAAAYIDLSQPNRYEPYHPGWDPRKIIARNEAWMQRDFARALQAADDDKNDLAVEPAYSFDLSALLYEVFGVDTGAHDSLEPELHGGHLLFSCGAWSEEWMSDGIGFVHIDLNVVDPKILRQYGKGTRRNGKGTPEGVSWLPWPVSVEAWGLSQSTHELVIICADRLDESLPDLPDNAIEIHVLDLKTHRNTQPPSIHVLPHESRSISTLKIYKGRLLIVQSEDFDDITETSAENVNLVVFDLKPTVRILTTLPLEGSSSGLDSAKTFHQSSTGVTIPRVLLADTSPEEESPLSDTYLESRFDDPGLQKSAIELSDGTWLTEDLFAIVGTPVDHLWNSDQFYCHLDVYSITKPTSLLVRQPLAIKSFFNPLNLTPCMFELEDVRISAEPDACSPVAITAAWKVIETPIVAQEGIQWTSRRDRVFVDRTELLAIAKEQLASRDAAPITPIILSGVALRACPLYSTVNSSTMHTTHRGRHVGIMKRQHLQGESHSFLYQRAREAEGKEHDGGYLLTISQIVPSATMRDDMPTPQQLQWLGLDKQVSMHPDLDPSVPKPLDGWVPSVFWDWARQPKGYLTTVEIRPEERVPSLWKTTYADVPRKDYVAFCRVVDLDGIATEEHALGDLAMDDDRVVMSAVGSRSGDLRVYVLPLHGPKVPIKKEEQ